VRDHSISLQTIIVRVESVRRTHAYLSLLVSIMFVSYSVVSVGAAQSCQSSCPQFTLSLNFSDPSGQHVSPPSSLTLRSGSTTTTVTSYTGILLNAGVWTVSNVTWEGKPNAQSGNASFDLSSGPLTGTLVLRAYNAVVLVVDNANNPVAGAEVVATLSNTTVRIITTDGQGKAHLGHIPLGPYTIQVNYQGRQMGNWNTDASTRPTFTAKLDTSGSQLPTLSDPLTMLSQHWQLAAMGFFAGFVAMGIAVRRPRAKVKPSEIAND
jgi:carboxypeptidase family protein